MSHNKSRKGFRGAKKRQSVIRAEISQKDELRFEKICRAFCETYGFNLEDYLGSNPKRLWHETHRNIINKVLTIDGVIYLGPLFNLSE
jgi:hypothetical protein